MKINKEWHEKHKMPKNATFEQRVKWHMEHIKHCECRPMPEKLRKEMNEKIVRRNNNIMMKQEIIQKEVT